MASGLKLRKAGAAKAFVLAHHLTFGAVRSPSGLALLDLPLLLGPVGGGEPLIPMKLWPTLGLKEAFFEIQRQMILWCSLRFDPFVRKTLNKASVVLFYKQLGATEPREPAPGTLAPGSDGKCSPDHDAR